MATKTHQRGLLITLFAVLILSPDALLVKLMHCDAWTMLFWRSLISGTSLTLGLGLIYHRRLWPLIVQIGRYGLISALVTACGSLLFIGALYRTTAANTLVILAATPLFAALIGRLFIQEKIARYTLVAIITTTGGILLIFADSFSTASLTGNLMALAASSLWGANLVVLRRARRLNMIPAIGLGSFLAIPLCLLLGADPLSISPHDLSLLTVQGALVLPVSFALITLGSRYLPAAEVSLVLLLETLLGPLWVWLLVGEVPGRLTLGAGFFIFLTLLIHSLVALRVEAARNRATTC